MALATGKPAEEATVRLLRRIALFIAFIVFAIVLTFCYFASEFAISIILSAILAILIDPLVVKMQRAHLSRAAAAGIVVLCGSLIFIALAFVFYQKISAFGDQLPQYSQQIECELRPLLKKFPSMEKSLKPSSNPQKMHQETEQWTSTMLRGAGSVRTLLVIAGVAPFLVFFMLVRKDQMYYRAMEILEGNTDAGVLIANLNSSLRGVAFSYLIVGSVMAAVASAVFEALHLHSAIVLGIISGYVNLIPYVGAVIGIVLPLAGAMQQFTNTLVPGAVIVLTVLALHFITGNIVAPRWVGPRVQVGPAAVLAGMLFWGWLWGIIGIVLAVPLTACLKVVADQHPRLTRFSDLLADHLDIPQPGAAPGSEPGATCPPCNPGAKGS